MTDVVAIEDLHYAYPPLSPGGASPPVLQGVSLCLAEGECLALLGRTGAGKSTLCLTLNGIIPQLTGGVFQGSVRVAGRDTREAGPGELSQVVGLVFQDPESQFFNMTVEDEVAFGPEGLALAPHEIERRIEEALEMTGIADLRTRSPLELSGGEKQRVALAAVLAMWPRILVLDEPAASLDPAGKRSLLEAVDRLRRERGTTVLWVTQDVDRLPLLADRVAVLDQGRIALEGDLREILGQLDRLSALGVGCPQMAELGARFDAAEMRNPAWLTVDEAGEALREIVRDRGGPSPRLARAGPVDASGQGLSSGVSAAPTDRVGRPCVRGGFSVTREPAIELERCTYSYDGQVPALRGVSCSVEAGGWVALMGQNGSGKTTLAKLCNGLLRPAEGRVLIAGQDIRRRSVGEVAHQVGYLFQNPDHQIFASTVREEVAFGLRNLGFRAEEIDERTERALALFDLTEHSEQPPAVLGHGLRRQVTLASLLAQRPPILILDEPTSGLDWETSNRLLRHLSELRDAGHTVLFITHDVRLVAQWAMDVVVLHQGEVLTRGTAREILAQPELLARASISPPPITRLSQDLRPCGMTGDSLSVESFYGEFVALLAARGAAGP